LSPEKLIKYSLPFFIIAILSRAIEEISFVYYSVPVTCFIFIVLLLVGSKNKFNHINAKEDQESDIRNQVSGIGSQVPDQHLLRQRRISLRLASTIFHQPFTISLLPGIWFLLTSLWSSHPEVSAARALYFILISAGCMSAGFLWIRYSGKNIFDFLLPANILVVLLCLFSLISNIPSDSWTAGHGKGFTGFFVHQNTLASLLLFTMPVVFGKIKDKSRKIKFFYFPLSARLARGVRLTPWSPATFGGLLLSLNLSVLALTYSRGSILSLIFGVIVFLLITKKWKILSYTLITAAVLAVIIIAVPPIKESAGEIIRKDFPDLFSSRIWLWEASFNAAKNGGLTGLGYGISHPDIRSGGHGDHFEGERFVREKGNSSLALIEETGLTGLMLFILPIIYLLIKFRDTRPCLPAGRYQIPDTGYQKKAEYPESGIRHQVPGILIASFAAFLLHAQLEAWWVGVGSVQLPLFFVFIGLIINQSVRKIG
jgi:O-antigen ligase